MPDFSGLCPIKKKLESLKDQTKESESPTGYYLEGIDIELITQEVGERYHKETGELYAARKAGFARSRYLPG